MRKPRYRYNHKTKRWDILVNFPTSRMVCNGTINPNTNLPNMYEDPYRLRIQKPTPNTWNADRRKEGYE